MASTPRARLAPICQGKYDGAQRDAEHAGRGIWGDCSADANSHT